MAIIASTIIANIYVEILDNFLIPSIEKLFIFQDDNASCQREKKELKLSAGNAYKIY